MPYADYRTQRDAQALWYWVQYNAPGDIGKQFRKAESERKKKHWRETMTEEEKERRRKKAREGMRKIRLARKAAESKKASPRKGARAHRHPRPKRPAP